MCQVLRNFVCVLLVDLWNAGSSYKDTVQTLIKCQRLARSFFIAFLKKKKNKIKRRNKSGSRQNRPEGSRVISRWSEEIEEPENPRSRPWGQSTCFYLLGENIQKFTDGFFFLLFENTKFRLIFGHDLRIFRANFFFADKFDIFSVVNSCLSIQFNFNFKQKKNESTRYRVRHQATAPQRQKVKVAYSLSTPHLHIVQREQFPTKMTRLSGRNSQTYLTRPAGFYRIRTRSWAHNRRWHEGVATVSGGSTVILPVILPRFFLELIKGHRPSSWLLWLFFWRGSGSRVCRLRLFTRTRLF